MGWPQALLYLTSIAWLPGIKGRQTFDKHSGFLSSPRTTSLSSLWAHLSPLVTFCTTWDAVVMVNQARRVCSSHPSVQDRAVAGWRSVTPEGRWHCTSLHLHSWDSWMSMPDHAAQFKGLFFNRKETISKQKPFYCCASFKPHWSS